MMGRPTPLAAGAAIAALWLAGAAALAAGAQGDDPPGPLQGPRDRDPARATDGGPPPVPEDTLRRPLLRKAPLGAEELQDGFTATEAQVALGRRLFFDPRLSSDGTVACATCHRPEYGFADPRPLSIGVGGARTKRNAPSLFNKGISVDVHWDGAAATLEAQALMPIEDPGEMGIGVDGAVAFLAADDDYRAAFEAAYGRPPDAEALGGALAAFVRALTVGDSPVDRFRDGDVDALSPEAEAGLWLFEGKGRCWRCHEGPNFSDESFHNTGVGTVDGASEDGRFRVTGEERDRGRFRTPGLRMLTRTAPYMHDGSLATLAEVVDFYREGGIRNPNLSDRIAPIQLTDREAAHLVAFLEALSR